MNRDLFLAILAMDSYNRRYGEGIKGLSTTIGNSIGNASIITDSTLKLGGDPTEEAGFYAIAYSWNGETVVSYRGTDFVTGDNLFDSPLWKDVSNGWATGIGFRFESQADLAVQFYKAVANQLGASDPRTANITTTGHSLGGGLGGLVSMLYGRPGVEFDNMPFEAAAQGTWTGALDEIESSYWPSRRAEIYGSTAPWALDGSRVRSIYTDNEVLESLRQMQTAPQQALASHTDLGLIGLHSQALLVSLLWAEQNGKTDWYSAGQAIGHVIGSDAVGDALLRVQGSGPAATGAAGVTDQVMRAIAYSAISEGERPFGDTAIISLFNDATDLGRALDRPGASSTLKASADAIAQSFVQFAGKLALGDVEGGAAASVAKGVVTLATDGQTLAVDFASGLWSNGAAHREIVGRKELIATAIATVDKTTGAGSDIATGVRWLYNDLSNDYDTVDRVVFQTTNVSAASILPPRGDFGGKASLFVGGDGDDHVTGSASNEIIHGGAGADHLDGGAGDDLVAGGSGNDILAGGPGRDFLAGGDGFDTIDYKLQGRSGGVQASIKAIGAVTSDERPSLEIEDATGIDRVIDVEMIGLTDQSDTVKLTGNVGDFQDAPTIDMRGSAVAFNQDIVDGSGTDRGIYIDLGSGRVMGLDKDTDVGFFGWIGERIKAAFRLADITIINGNQAIGTEYSDYLIASSGAKGSGEGYSALRGGDGSDLLVGGGWESHLFGGNGDDQFAIGANAWIEDSEAGDTVTYGGIPIYGGTKQWWMEGNTAYWAPFNTLLNGFPVIGSSVLTAAAFFIDVATMKFASFQRTGGGDMLMKLGWGQAGSARIKDYNLDLDSGVGTAGVTVFEESSGGVKDPSLERISKFVNLALYAGFGSGLSSFDPLVLDLDGDGFNLTTEANSDTYFEFDTDGFAEHTGWVKPTDGLLARDANGNGVVDNITELFGNRTMSGFAMLAEYDGNGDGVINAADTVYDELLIWRDVDQDGDSDAGELKTLAEMGIVSISLSHAAPANPKDVAGNTIVHLGQFTRADGSIGGVADVAFDISETDTRWMGDRSVGTTAAALPQLTGFGVVKDLRVAMTNDAALQERVASFVANPSNNLSVLKMESEAILYRWANVDDLAVTVLGANGFDTRKLAFLEKYSGVELMPRDASGTILQTNITEMEELWADQVTRLTLKLVVQGPLADVFAGITYMPDRDMLVAATPAALSEVLRKILADLPADATAAQAQWASWAPLLGAFTESLIRHDANIVRGDFVFAQLVSGMDGVVQPLSLDQLASGLAISNMRIGTAAVETLARGAADGTAIYYAAGGDTLNGGSGQDAYIFGRSIGHATINDEEAKPTGDRIRFAFLNADQVTMQRDGNDLLITVKVTGETVRVVGQFAPVTPLSSDVLLSSNKGVEDIQFADGTVMEIPEIMAAVGTGTAGDDHMVGTMHSDVFLGGLGDDRLEGGDDADLYVVNAGEGQDVISDVQTTVLLRAADMLVFGDGIAPQDLVFSRTGGDRNDLLISIGTGGQSILIENQFDYSVLGYNAKFDANSRIEAFAFREYGEGWSSKDLQQKLIAQATTSKSDETIGFGDDDLFAASAGNDLLIGLDGADTYRWGKGSGSDTIDERSLYVDVSVGMSGLVIGGKADTVEFEKGLTAADITFSRSATGPDLVITITATGETLTVKKQFDGFQSGPLGAQWVDRVEWFAFEDGTRLSWQDVLLDVTTGTDGDDVLIGDLYKDRLEGKAGNDVLSGRGLGDTYVFKLGYGLDTIDDANDSFLGAGFVTLDTDPDILELGAGITAASIVFSRNGDDISLSFGGSDKVTLKGQNDYFPSGIFGNLSTNRIEQVRLDDGSTLSWQEINKRTIAADTTSGNDVTHGFKLEDRMIASAGNDVLAGGDSADTYEFGKGSGHDIIRESVSNVLFGDQDLVEFGAGVTAEDVLVSRSGDTLILTLASTGDTLTIENEFAIDAWYTWTDVERFRFADGREWTKEDLQRRLLQSTSGDDNLVAFDSDDVLDGGAGNDILVGRDGSDEYHFGRGNGIDVIRESRGNHNLAENDRLTFGAGIVAADILVSREADDLILTIAGTIDSIRIEGQFNFDQWFSDNDVESFHFADGTVWSDRDVAAMLTGGTAGDDRLIGTFRSDVLDGQAGNDVLEGGDGSDTYNFGRGYGQDEIRESRSSANLAEDDQLRFGPEITLADLGFERSGDDLIITILGTSDTVRVTGQFSYSAFQAWDDLERFTFADGSFLTKQEATQITLRPRPTDDHFVGSIDGDTLDGGAGNDLLEGRDGSDTYRFGLGSGQDEIRESVSHVFLSDFDVVAFGRGVTPENVLLSRAGDDLIISIAGTSDRLTIKDQFDHGSGYTWSDIERFDFADATSWSKADLYARLLLQSSTGGDDVIRGFETADVVRSGAGNDSLTGDTNNDQLFGEAGNDTLDGQQGDDLLVGGIGDDLLSGGGGNDVFRIELGDGNDIIREMANFEGRWGGRDRIDFGKGILPVDVKITFADNGADLVLKIGATQTVTLDNTVNDPDYHIEEVTFADGTSWLADELLSRANAPTAGNDLQFGGGGADIISGGAGDDVIKAMNGNDLLAGDAGRDTLHGGGGDDIYRFSRGDGQDIINDFISYDSYGGLDTVEFTSGITPSDITIVQADNGQDLILKINGTTDQIVLDQTIVDGLYGGEHRIERVRFADGTVWNHAELIARSYGATEGSDTITGDNSNNHIDGLAGNDTINARGGDDILVGGAGNDLLSGAGGHDIYRFARGDGQDIIRDFNGDYATYGGTDTIEFAEGIDPSEVVVSQVDGGESLLLTISGTLDQIILDRTMSDGTYGGEYRIERVRFADGTTWSHAELVTRSTSANPGNDIFYGSTASETLSGGAGDDRLMARAGNDILIAGLGNDTLSGDGGDDTYVFERGDGQDIITEESGAGGWGGNDTLSFGVGIAPSDITVTQGDSGKDLILSINGTTDRITINDTMITGDQRVEQVLFADGTVWTHAELVARSMSANSGDDVFSGSYNSETVSGGTGNDVLKARGGNDTVIGGLGNDALSGDGGDDTYVFERGDGQDIIREESGAGGWGGNDTVRFGAGIAPSDILVTQAGNGAHLVLSLAGTMDTITVERTMTDGAYRLEQVRFADGTVWSHADLVSRSTSANMGNDGFFGSYDTETLSSGAGDDIIKARNGNDTLIGGTGNDTLSGDGGNDTYIFNLGDGQDIIREESGAGGWGGNDTLVFGVGITPENITVTQTNGGKDLVLSIRGTTDRVTINETMVNVDYRLEQVRFADGTVLSHAQLVERSLEGTDASDTINGSDANNVIKGFAGDDALDGRGGDDTLVGGTGNDVINGGLGNDIYVFNRGDGQDTLREWTAGGFDTVQFGDAIFASDLSVSLSSNGEHLILALAGTTDKLTLEWEVNYENQRFEQVRFADGSTLSHAQLMNLATTPSREGNGSAAIKGTNGSDTLYGTSGADAFVGGLGNDVIYSSAGSDTFHYSSGDGSDYIDDEASSRTDVDTLILSDLNPADIQLSRQGVHGTLLVKATGHVITFDEQFYNADFWGIERISFADGTIWDRGRIQLESWFRGSDNSDTLYGTGSADTFMGGLGNDTIYSGGGSDIFYYSSGDGSDYIDDEASSRTDVDTLILRDLNPADIQLSRQGVHSTLLVKATGHVITLDEQFYNADFWGIERISFADGTVWDRGRIQLESWFRGTNGADTLYGTGGADTFVGGRGDDRINSSAGSDTFYYSSGDGSDYIDDEASSRTDVDTLILRDLNPSDIQLSRQGVHSTLLVKATGHVITLDEQFYNGDFWGIEQISFADGTIWDRARIQLESDKPAAQSQAMVSVEEYTPTSENARSSQNLDTNVFENSEGTEIYPQLFEVGNLQGIQDAYFVV